MSSYVSRRKTPVQYEVTCGGLEGLIETREKQLGAGISTKNKDGTLPDTLERATWNAANEVSKLFQFVEPLKLYVSAGSILGKTKRGCFLLKLQPCPTQR